MLKQLNFKQLKFVSYIKYMPWDEKHFSILFRFNKIEKQFNTFIYNPDLYINLK